MHYALWLVHTGIRQTCLLAGKEAVVRVGGTEVVQSVKLKHWESRPSLRGVQSWVTIIFLPRSSEDHLCFLERICFRARSGYQNQRLRLGHAIQTWWELRCPSAVDLGMSNIEWSCNPQVFGWVTYDAIQRNKLQVVFVVISNIKGTWLISGSSWPKSSLSRPYGQHLDNLLKPSWPIMIGSRRKREEVMWWLGPFNLKILKVIWYFILNSKPM